MFTEYEVELMIENDRVLSATRELKKTFCKEVAPYLQISDQDFLSLLFLTPSVGIALANDDVSLKEELALNKKARKLSKGRYFFKKDPVVVAMQFMIKHYKAWEDRFFTVLKDVMKEFFDAEQMDQPDMPDNEKTYRMMVLNSPYILVRFMAAFFLDEDDHAFSVINIRKTEFEALQRIGESLGFGDLVIFKGFCRFTFHVK
jgi:hypothetical protein